MASGAERRLQPPHLRRGSSGRRCWRSVGASVLRRSIARFVAATSRSRSRRRRGRVTEDAAAARASRASRCASRLRTSLSASIHGGATPALRSTRNPSARSPAAESSSSGSGTPGTAVRRMRPLHRLADLSLDDALPRRTDRELALADRVALPPCANRSGRVTGKLTRVARIVRATCKRSTASRSTPPRTLLASWRASISRSSSAPRWRV